MTVSGGSVWGFRVPVLESGMEAEVCFSGCSGLKGASIQLLATAYFSERGTVRGPVLLGGCESHMQGFL